MSHENIVLMVTIINLTLSIFLVMLKIVIKIKEILGINPKYILFFTIFITISGFIYLLYHNKLLIKESEKTEEISFSIKNDKPVGNQIVNQIVNKPEKMKCQGYSTISYEDENGNIFHAKFSDKGYIESICCEKTGKDISWRSFRNSPTFPVRKDTSIIIQKAVKWLKKNEEDHYIYLTTK